MKKCIITVVALFVYIFIADMIFHGFLLRDTYMATAQLWRPEADMKSYMIYMIAGQFLIALFMASIFTHGYKGTGIKEGVKFGLLLGGLEAGKNLIMYSVAPYPMSLTLSWIGIAFVESVIAGIILAKIWGNETCCGTGKAA